MYLPHMTWEEVSILDRSVVVVVPFGSMEQHSLHLPLATDSLITQTITRHLEQEFPEGVLMLPVTWLVCSRHHMDFANSLPADTKTSMSVCENIVLGMSEHRFRNFIC